MIMAKRKSSSDELVKTNKNSKVELTEDELSKVSGGNGQTATTALPTESFSLNFSKITWNYSG
jgi:bacteriocin-like protein